ncbi:auxin-responsive protein IAA28 [Vigna unguiculata]|uniref:Auxin-induced protein n=1 Tax=Vigna unguiculata TaxID=3917 RepID=A0A4D6NQZ9_VIGUN|nr:auxin-responsive protein IAA28 [Vigna unguiculata]QCD81686.1 auxin-responsive protein IAA [Vigna unguiculata]QCE16253.1 auxin-responsive protein IAA [Vigna unguiculata]
MELQLGLALSTAEEFKSKQIVSSELWRPSCGSESGKHVKHKRNFEESFQRFLKPFPLLVWSGQPNEEDDRSQKLRRNIHTPNKNGNEENHLVGWPPVKSWRRKELHQHHPGRGEIRNVGIQNQSRGPNSLYVKVNMEGVTIGRKINLRLFNSYKTLTNALINMFAKYQKLEEAGESYTLTFRNEQGDWLQVGHVPWQSFVDTVRRLVLLKNGSETI